MRNRLDSRSLAQFLAVAESLSFRQAAETLHMSQPPLSRSIRELEARLGVPLFDRDTQRVALTAAGRRLLPRARKIVQLLTEAEDAVVADEEPTSIRLGLTNAVALDWLLALVDRIRAESPGLSIATVSDSSPRLVRSLRAQRLDAAFIALPTEADGLDVIPLARQRMVVAMTSAHRLARRRSLRLRDLDDERLFWFERARQPAFFDHCQRVFAQHGYVPHTVREPLDHHVLLSHVARGRSVALLPESFASLRKAGVVYRTLVEGEAMAIGIGLVMPPGRIAFREALLRCTAAALRDDPG